MRAVTTSHSRHTRWSAARRPVVGVALALAVVLTLAGCSALSPTTPGHGTPPGRPAPRGAYVPATDRNADFLGESPLTSTEVHDIATDDGWYTLAKFSDHYDLRQQFADASTLMTAAKAAGNPDLHVGMYYNAMFWLTANSAWGSYAEGFDPSWLLHDATGSTVAYHGQGSSGSAEQSLGDVVDLQNPTYRAWAVQTVVDWMHQAPVRGITLDSADLIVGTTVRSDVGTGTQTWNDLLCGAGAPVDTDGNCPVVAAWNQGLHDLLAQMSAALTPLGDTVTFNGVAPSQLRTADRNTELFASASHADNEGFCYAQSNPKAAARESGKRTTASGGTTGSADPKTKLNPLPADVAMMQQRAADGAGITEITNYEQSSREDLGAYCLGGFLLGWQPGYDWFVYHRDYTDTLGGGYPELPEQDLDLGTPTGQAGADGSLMTRTFTHGLVAVDTGDGSVTYTVPTAVTQFAGGREVHQYAAGSTVTLAAHGADFFLTDAFVATLG